jgi:hypothetical protein
MGDTQKPPKSLKAAISEMCIGAGMLLLMTRLKGGIVKVTALIAVLLALAMASGSAMVISVKKEPVLLACGGPNC